MSMAVGTCLADSSGHLDQAALFWQMQVRFFQSARLSYILLSSFRGGLYSSRFIDSLLNKDCVRANATG
jgi:hypothetical protein